MAFEDGEVEALLFEVVRVELEDEDRQRLSEDVRGALIEMLGIQDRENNGLFVDTTIDFGEVQTLMSLHCVKPPEMSSKRMVISEPV
jgi:hypothetical protein